METAGRENPKRWATTSQQPSPWRGRSEQISFIQMGCEARKLPAPGEIFFLTSPFIELNQNACLRPRRIRLCSQFYGTQATVYKTVVVADLSIKVAPSDSTDLECCF